MGHGQKALVQSLGAFAGAAFTPAAHVSLAVPCPAATSSSPTAPPSCGDIPLPLRRLRPLGTSPVPAPGACFSRKTLTSLLATSPFGCFSQPLISRTSDPAVIICRHTSARLSAREGCTALSAPAWQRWPWRCRGSDATRPRSRGHSPPVRISAGMAGVPEPPGSGGMRRCLGVPLERCERLPECERRGWVRCVPSMVGSEGVRRKTGGCPALGGRTGNQHSSPASCGAGYSERR